MTGRHIRLPGNYLDNMRSRLSMRGAHNKRKLLILQALFERGSLTSRELYQVAGRGCSYASVRANLTRLVRYRYINRLSSHKYTILVKGVRFIYAVRELFPDIYQSSVDEVLS